MMSVIFVYLMYYQSPNNVFNWPVIDLDAVHDLIDIHEMMI